MIRRAAVMVVAMSTLLIGVAVLPALAKMPPFELDVTFDDGVALIGVRVLGFQGSSLPPEGFDPADLDGVVAVYPSTDLDARGRPVSHQNAVEVDLERSDEPGLYEGRVALETPGSWAVVPFPTIIDFDPDSAVHGAYPSSLFFDVPADRASILAIGGWVVVLLAIGIVTVARRGRGAPDPQTEVPGSIPTTN